MRGTAQQLQDLNGLLATEIMFRREAGDRRDRSDVADDVLRDCEAPDLRRAIERLQEMIVLRHRQRQKRIELPDGTEVWT